METPIAHRESANMTPRLSVHFSIFGLVFSMLKSLLGISRRIILNFIQKASESCQNFNYRTSAIVSPNDIAKLIGERDSGLLTPFSTQKLTRVGSRN